MRDGLLDGKFDGLYEEFQGTLQRQNKGLVDAQNIAAGDRKNSIVKDCQSQMNEMDGMLAQMSSEIDRTSDKRKQADMRAKLSRCKRDMATLKGAFSRVSLGVGGGGGGGGGESNSRDGLLRLKQMQDSSNARLGRIERSLGETEEVGANTLGAMENQSNRYAKTVDRLKEAGSNIDAAGSTNRSIWRGQQLDKCIYCFTILALLTGLGFLIAHLLGFGKK